jgi:hypothetical protein
MRVTGTVAVGVVVCLLLLAAPASGAARDEDFALLDVKVTDTQGVATEVLDFGFATGANLLQAHRGDAEVDLPLRLVRSLEIGEIVERSRKAPCRATLRTGKVVQLEIDHTEMIRLLAGTTDFGDYRIRLAKVRRLDVLRSEADPQP